MRRFFLKISEEMRSPSAPFATVRLHRLERSFLYFLCIRIVKVALKIFVSQFLPHFKVLQVFSKNHLGIPFTRKFRKPVIQEECSQTWADVQSLAGLLNWLGWPNLTL